MSEFKNLLEQFKPNSYDLVLDIYDIKQETFRGKCLITGTKTSSNHYIELHSKDLVYEKILINSNIADYTIKDGKVAILTEVNMNEECTIELHYKGLINDVMNGLYPSYFNYKNETEKILATQFESCYARQVFPCIDEPSAKSVFNLTLVHSSKYSAISNTKVRTATNQGKKTTTIFETTPIMSTYLLGFSCGKIHNISGTSKSGVEINVWSAKTIDKSYLQFSLDVSIKALDFYEEYFGVKFPLKKIDHIALPDFSSGAMENWGMITYREEALLVNDVSSIADKKSVAKVIAHELAHQWFGNLVTMKWWDDLWLNESFATYIEYVAVDYIFPEWKIWDDFLSNEVIYALSRDCFMHTQAVRTKVNKPDEISSIFDGAIVYAKGARLIAMINQYIGEQNFKIGLHNYFRHYKYSNADSDDLWGEFAKVTDLNIKEIIQPWLDKPGYPVVIAKNNSLTQKRFIMGSGKDEKSLWPIPLDSDNTIIPKILEDRSIKIKFNDNYRLNKNGISHFISSYGKDLYNNITANLISPKTSDIERLCFINEQLLLARSNYSKYSDLIKFIDLIKSESSYKLWEKFLVIVSEIDKIAIADKNSRELFNNFIDKLTKIHFNKLGVHGKEKENENTKQLRAIILTLRNKINDKTLQKIASIDYSNLKFEVGDPETRHVFLSAAVKSSVNIKLEKSMLEEYVKTQSPSLKSDIVAALSFSRNDEFIKNVFQSLLNPKIIKPQDLHLWVSYLFAKNKTRSITWDWIKANWSELERIYDGDNAIEAFPRIASRFMKTESELNDYVDFFKTNNNELISRSVDIGIEEIKQRIITTQKQKKEILRALNNLNPSI